MRDDQHRAPLHDFAHVLLDDALAFVIKRAGRFVENQDARVHDESASDGDALALAAGEVRSALAYLRVIALRQFEDEVVRARQPRGLDDALDRHAGVGQRDVVADRAVEQDVFLQHYADLTAQPRHIDHRQIDAVHDHLAAFRHIKALHQLGERRFAGARSSDDAHHLSRRDRQRNVAQNFRAIDFVTEGDMIESNRAPDVRQGRAPRRERRFGMRVEDVAEARDRNPRLMKILPHLREAQHRLRHMPGQPC
jgi:hypothetical protein